MRKNLLLTFIALTLTLPALAQEYDFYDGTSGLYFNIVDGGVEVTYENITTADYSDSVDIPETVFYNGSSYDVIGIGDNAFQMCTSLTSVTIPASVTTIGSYAFESCSSLTSVTIPASVTTIGSYAFENCSSLTSVTIPASVTTIGERAFGHCKSLKKFVVEEGSQYYCTDDDGVLYNIDKTTLMYFPAGSSLTTYTIPESVTAIGIYAFCLSSNLTSVIIGDNVTTIGEGAFYSCSGLTEITIPNSVTTIGDYAFYGCSKLQTVTMGSGVTTIGRWAFQACTSLTTVTIGSSVTEIGNYAFQTCSKLSTIIMLCETPPTCGTIFSSSMDTSSITLYVPKGTYEAYSSDSTWGECNIVVIAEVGDKFEYNGLYYNVLSTTEVEVTWGGESETSGTDSYTGSITIPKTVFNGVNYNVIGIGDYAFNSCTLTSIDIPSSVTYIGVYAFQFCESLTSIDVPSTIETLGYAACASCTSLETATLNCGAIAEWAFNQCDELTTVIINSATIGSYSFEYCSNITSLTLGDNVISIGICAFACCTGITKLEIPESVTEIGVEAFYGCASLVTLTIGSGVTTIGYAAFYKCTSLTELTIPNSVTEIGGFAFYECTSLEKLTIGSGVMTMGDAVFAFCSSLTTAEINCPAIGKWAFEVCSNLALLTLGDNVTTIGYAAFLYCTSLTELTIPNSVTEIGDGAFQDCTSLISVTIGSSVETIGESAFYECAELKSIISLNPTPPSLYDYDEVFYNCNATIYVPAGTIDEYEYLWGSEDDMNMWGSNLSGVKGYDELGYAVIKIEAEEGYATYYNKDYDVTMPDGITAYVTSSVSLDEDDSSSLSIRLVGLAGLVPAGTAVVIKGNVGTYLYVDVSQPASTTSYDNMLYGNSTTGNTSVDGTTSGYYFYKLTRNTADEVGSMGFYWGEEGGASFSIPGNKAWLAISQSVFDNVASPTSLSIKIGEEDDITTGISSVESMAERSVSGIYTLKGVRVSDMSRKGVYIVDGKKVVKR